MRARCGNLIFTSDFDSGNLAKVALGIPEYSDLWSTSATSNSDNKTDSPKNGGNSSACRINSIDLADETKPDVSFLLWTQADCAGTKHATHYRSWFYFGIEGAKGQRVRLCIVNLNKQIKLYSSGMKPVYMNVPSDNMDWKRIPESVSFWKSIDNEGWCCLSFCHTLPNDPNVTTYFCFTYPFTYHESNVMLNTIDQEIGSSLDTNCKSVHNFDKIYYARELLCYSLDNLKIEVITITSHHGLQSTREARLPNLFPNSQRCHEFLGKKVVFLSSRVHPGETQSSYIFQGFLNFILSKNDPRAKLLRQYFIFKLIPNLNPDGVIRGHYRCDSRGVNLNRVYLNADFKIHPSIYAARSLILYYHAKYAVISLPKASSTKPMNHDAAVNTDYAGHSFKFVQSQQEQLNNQISAISKLAKPNFKSMSDPRVFFCQPFVQSHHQTSLDKYPPLQKCARILERLEKGEHCEQGITVQSQSQEIRVGDFSTANTNGEESPDADVLCNAENDSCSSGFMTIGSNYSTAEKSSGLDLIDIPKLNMDQSGLAFYIDLHGHASKRGCFIYGNYLTDPGMKVESLLLPKIASLNCPHFDLMACAFTVENSQKGNTSKEGSGRCAVYTMTGVPTSYTVECNYNTGRIMNSVPSLDERCVTPPPLTNKTIPLYTPDIFRQIGKSLAISMLDCYNLNPHSRLVATAFHNSHGVREWIKKNLYSSIMKKLDKPFPRVSNSKNGENSRSLSVKKGDNTLIETEISNNIYWLIDLLSPKKNNGNASKKGSKKKSKLKDRKEIFTSKSLDETSTKDKAPKKKFATSHSDIVASKPSDSYFKGASSSNLRKLSSAMSLGSTKSASLTSKNALLSKQFETLKPRRRSFSGESSPATNTNAFVITAASKLPTVNLKVTTIELPIAEPKQTKAPSKRVEPKATFSASKLGAANLKNELFLTKTLPVKKSRSSQI